jgi:Rps23 Pro-64 3,4-dihydroxylase Tpa1-like proline 4-hydroxylase
MNVISKTVPISVEDGISLSLDEAAAYGQELNFIYTANVPFQHIVIDNFLPDALIEKILALFPDSTTNKEVNYEKGYKGLHKRQINPNECDAFLRNVFAFFNSAPMLQLFENLTSIDGLIPDPYFTGGGLHETKTGGLLGVHADFRINRKLHVERRINAIIYLNKDWQSSYGGNLELWDKEMTRCIKQVEPIFNRCVVFNTDHDSNHGHPEPLNTPESVSRKSMALYYYTASKKVYEGYDEFRTYYKPRPKDGFLKRLVYKLRKI